MSLERTYRAYFWCKTNSSANPIFLELLRKKLPGIELIPSDFPNGSALGAAMLVNMNPSA